MLASYLASSAAHLNDTTGPSTMKVQVFISATSQDLLQDCRPRARQAIEMCQAAAVTMETWDVDFVGALEACQQKLEQESSHFVGIFAYRYGWIPPGLTVSITQKEFEWAHEFPKPMAVFVPNHTTSFAQELRQRASNQSAEEKQAQEKFLKLVSATGTYQPFDDITDLSMRIVRKVMIWQQGGSLRAIARDSDSAAAATVRASDNDLVSLVGKKQAREFEDTLDAALAAAGAPRIAFLIHGKPGYGHEKLLDRLALEFEQRSTTDPRSVTVTIDALWRHNSVASLVGMLAEQLQPGSQPATVAELAHVLATCLQQGDVLLRLNDVQRIDGGLAGFQQHFWLPLAQALPASQENQLVLLLEHENESPIAAPAWLLDAADELARGSASNSGAITALTPLGSISAGELQAWLRKWKSAQEAKVLAETLINESSNGTPHLLFSKILELDLS